MIKDYNNGDYNLFIKCSPLGRLTTKLVYVDDIIVIGNNKYQAKIVVKYFHP